ncbi:SDR family NAD(P)-dependent oxidoreductase [Cyclobacterium xiamenense]|uniref:SDR family NAD(P)-dependent oxidoreductase n=1 Tax=Cyclobacterium xiamenense TaxID=1297121 RepID=UPI0012B83AED|nr:SDR family NAD(P)-dependent oxidoreductase [Cyclobacterium xiamenense]
MKINGKLAVVTGASRGIGAATAILLAEKGAQVILVARSKSDLLHVATRIRQAGGIAYIVASDLADAASTRNAAQAILQNHGVPDLLVNNAGAGRWLFAEETPEGEEDVMIALPYLAAFRLCRAFLPGMLSRRSGMILNVNSPASLIPWSGATGYAASRWALRGFTEALRADLHGTGMRVCEVMLGETSSNYFEANPGSYLRLPKLAKFLPLLTPEEAAWYIVKAVRQNRSTYTAPFLLAVNRFFLGLMPGLFKRISWKSDFPHP